MNRNDSGPAKVQIHGTKQEGSQAIVVVDSMCLGALRPGHCQEKLASATRGAGMSTCLGAQARTSISHVYGKGVNKMRYAETGFNLEIDLATGNIERVETDPRLTELHLGGLGNQRQDTLG